MAARFNPRVVSAAAPSLKRNEMVDDNLWVKVFLYSLPTSFHTLSYKVEGGGGVLVKQYFLFSIFFLTFCLIF